jgi:DNA-binding winged helix-turn-helix (wHTH) protein
LHIRFDRFELDSEARVLRRDGALVHLSPKAFGLLCALAEARPKAVDKQTLVEKLWPDSFVADGSLAVVATELRSALEDSVEQPRVLRTVPRFGYAFSADAVESSTLTPAPTAWMLNRTHRIPLRRGATVVGRDPGCDAMVDAESVSRRHAQVVLTETALTLEDLGSKNGTAVNDVRVTAPVTVSDGDRVTLGSVTFIVQIGSSETVTKV